MVKVSLLLCSPKAADTKSGSLLDLWCGSGAAKPRRNMLALSGWRLVAAPGRAEAAGVEREDLPAVALGQHLDARDPLDPLKAAPARRDQPHRRAVRVRQRLA